MTVARICPGDATHGAHRFTGQRCPLKPAKRGTDTAARKAQAEFRAALLAASDGRCTFHDADGNRCTETQNLEAAHASAYTLDGNFTTGAMLCPAHHLLFDQRRGVSDDELERRTVAAAEQIRRQTFPDWTPLMATTVFGVEVDELPDDITPLEVVVLVKALDQANDVCVYTRESASLSVWEAMGMLQMVADQRRNDCLESYEAGPE